MRRVLVGVVCLMVLGLAGCVMPDSLVPAACGERDPGLGDLVLEVTGTEFESEGYRWADAVRTVFLKPVRGGVYPANTEPEPSRVAAEAPIPPGDCVLFTGLSPGWYEVDTQGFSEEGTQGCGWYDADPKHIELSADDVNRYSVHSSLACP